MTAEMLSSLVLKEEANEDSLFPIERPKFATCNAWLSFEPSPTKPIQ